MYFLFLFLSYIGPEYGTIEAAWKGILTEAERLAEVHLKVKENLCAGEMQQIKTWQKDNYNKVCFKRKVFFVDLRVNLYFIFMLDNDSN